MFYIVRLRTFDKLNRRATLDSQRWTASDKRWVASDRRREREPLDWKWKTVILDSKRRNADGKKSIFGSNPDKQIIRGLHTKLKEADNK